MTDVFRLWGFEGELKGNEERLQARLPMFTRDGSDAVFLARKLDWSPTLPPGDVVRLTVEEAEEAGERLEMPGATLRVVSRQYVVVYGPLFDKHLQSLGVTWPRTVVQEGFKIELMSPVKFDISALLIESSARYRFDGEIANGKVTDIAREALAVMQGAGVDNTRPQLIRTLAVHFLAGETDHFLRVLRLGAARLAEDPQRLKREMHEHLQFVQSLPVVETEPQLARSHLGFRELPNRTVSHGRHAGFKRHAYRKEANNVSLSDLEVKRINSKKLTNWIVSEEQADT